MLVRASSAVYLAVTPFLMARKVQEGGAEAKARVCTEAMDFMEGMRDGWDGSYQPVQPNVVSFSIVIKVRCTRAFLSLLLF